MVFRLLSLKAETLGDTNPGNTFRCIVDEVVIADIISLVLVPPWDRRATSTGVLCLRFGVALDNVMSWLLHST